ncbi:MAG: hypothetical protein ACRDJU_03245, partial [Actinomycetota bacterium]
MSELDSPRVQPFSCPYCAEEDIVPWGAIEDPPGIYLCHSCERRFQLRYLGSGMGARPNGVRAPGPGQEAATSW